MSYLCEKYYKPITVQHYIADCVSWVPRLTWLDLRRNWTYAPALRMDLRMDLLDPKVHDDCKGVVSPRIPVRLEPQNTT